MDRQMRRFGSSFEHNRHALRIVDHLERRYARFDGLNLTFEVREGIVKHSRELAADVEPELQELLPGERPPLEAQLIDLADEIAYNTADIDDAFSTGLFSMEQIGESIPIFSELAETAENQFPGAPEHIRFWEIQRHLMNVLVSGLVQGTVEAANAAGVGNVADVRALGHRLARMTPAAEAINAQMRSLLVTRVYSYAQLIEDRSAAVDKLRLLFEYFLEHPERMAPGHRERLEEAPVHRVVCDYVAGMTDSYLLRTYKELVQIT
jgi:dGTPase